MSYYLVVFRSRSETMKFVNILNSYGSIVSIINTPRQLSISCGISAKISPASLGLAKDILKRRQFYTFAGIYYSSENEYKLA